MRRRKSCFPRIQRSFLAELSARDDHLQQARDNRNFGRILVLEKSEDPIALQWAAIAAFYSAVHCMEAHFAGFNLTHQSHQARLVSMADPQYGVSGTAYLAYHRLLRASMAARYYLYRPPLREVRELFDNYLLRITAFVGLEA